MAFEQVAAGARVVRGSAKLGLTVFVALPYLADPEDIGCLAPVAPRSPEA